MPNTICGKRALKRLANHLADVHELSSQERQPYLIRAKPTALDLENVLAELYRLIGNSKQQSKWNKSGIKNIPIRQPKSSRRRTKSNTKSAKNVNNTEFYPISRNLRTDMKNERRLTGSDITSLNKDQPLGVDVDFRVPVQVLVFDES
ncbi:Hypothetical predicted protein [Paramuricea clavata]|uniref:Uncharacterized protein n=1 Tax=Paramuricea clavata TaxID=317549 RepID=A0A6S7HPV7_PARCT|nr:Hypothetical predicted protein [Paramuricea clavata]